MPEPVYVPFFPKIPFIFRLPVRPAEPFGSWSATRYKPKFHDHRHINKMNLQKGNFEQFDTFEKIRRCK